MSDLRLVYDRERMTFDLALDGTGLAIDDGLETAIIVSLFSDARAATEDLDPDERDGDRRGWCGDVLPRRAAGVPRPHRRLGSRLWLRQREKQTQATLTLIKGDINDALAWMIEDGIAERFDVDAWYSQPGVLAIRILPVRPAADAISYLYQISWQAQAARDGVVIDAI